MRKITHPLLLCVLLGASAQAEDLTNATQIEITRTWSQEPI